MAKLYFKYGAVKASKTEDAISAANNYREQKLKALFVDAGKVSNDNIVISNSGLQYECIYMKDMENMSDTAFSNYDVIIVDDAQFITESQLKLCVFIADELNIPVICYGLRTNYKGIPFPGSVLLLCWANKLEQLKTVCWCGAAAAFNCAVDSNGNFVEDITGNNSDEITFRGLCRKHYLRKMPFRRQ